MVINILSQIENSNSNYNIDPAWIGIGNVISLDNFTWEDGRDSSVTEYTIGIVGLLSLHLGDRCVEFGSGGGWIGFTDMIVREDGAVVDSSTSNIVVG